MKGGYQIIDFGGIVYDDTETGSVRQGFNIPGIHEDFRKANGKPIMITGIKLKSGEFLEDCFVCATLDKSSNGTFKVMWMNTVQISTNDSGGGRAVFTNQNKVYQNLSIFTGDAISTWSDGFVQSYADKLVDSPCIIVDQKIVLGGVETTITAVPTKVYVDGKPVLYIYHPDYNIYLDTYVQSAYGDKLTVHITPK